MCRKAHGAAFATYGRVETGDFVLASGVMARLAPPDKRGLTFDQHRCGLHHFCFRARRREDVNSIHEFVKTTLEARVVHAPEEGGHFAPGYYSVLFEDPDGIRVAVCIHYRKAQTCGCSSMAERKLPKL